MTFVVVVTDLVYCLSPLLEFFNDPTDVGNLISGSSAFSKSSLNIWKFTVHILLKSGMENKISIIKNLHELSTIKEKVVQW